MTTPRLRSLRALSVTRLDRVSRAVAALALSVVGLSGAVASPAAAGFPSGAIINGDLFDRCFEIEAPSESGVRLRVIHKRGTAVLADIRVPNLDDTIACTATLKPGDTITIVDKVDPDLPAVRRTIDVPPLKLTMNAASDVITGTVPSVGPVTQVIVTDRVAGLLHDTLFIPVPTAPDFTLQLVSTLDFTGGDSAQLLWASPEGDVFRLTTAVPSVVVQPGSAVVSGTGKGRSTLSVVLRRNGTLRGAFSTTLAGDADAQIGFRGRFKRDGVLRTVGVGDTVSHSGVIGGPLLTVRDLALAVNPANGGSLSATCFPGSPFLVLLDGRPRPIGVADINGEVSIPKLVGTTAPLPSGLVVTLGCETPVGGGEVATFTVP